MAKDFLLEIGVEELPSAYMTRVIADLKSSISNKFKELRIETGEVEVYGTPRRLVVFVKDVAEKQADAVIENRGPKKNIAFDENGQPTKATLGFARSQGVNVEDLQIREVGGVEYLFNVKVEQGDETIKVLPNMLADLIKNISFPKSMRWGYSHIRFARPIRWILALYDKEVVNFSLENITSSNFTYGHRFLSSGRLEVTDIDSYFKLLEDHYVILDQEKRKNLIWEQVVKVAAEVGGTPMTNEDLLEEVTYLVEYPTAFYGEFSPSYLEVPVEVLTTSMIEHQRYFPVFDKDGKLLNGFIGVRNGTDYKIEIVRAGNERVLKARLEDALFFWNEDTKQPLDTLVEKLENVLFHEKLGSLLDKVKRIEKIALYIGEKVNLSTPEQISRAAVLCKADLVSSMVYEFPELQGIMGRYYALKSGENEEVAQAIFEHYLPRFAGDVLPETDTGKILSIAEKIDNMVGCFAIGIKPTGSQDPYALRRQAIGLVNILLASDLNINLADLLAYAYKSFAVELSVDIDETVNEVQDFILQRFRGVMLEQGVSYDVIDAVLAVPSDNIIDLRNKIDILSKFKISPEFEDFMVVFNRSNNLSKKWHKTQFDEGLLTEPSEILLNNKFKEMKPNVLELFRAGEYTQGLNLITTLRPAIDEFFGAVMVMVEDENLKSARLSLLKGISELCMTFADFSKIVN